MSLYIGLISGTSADAIDAALVDFSAPNPRVLHTLAKAIPAPIRAEILALYEPDTNEIDRMGSLDRKLGELFAQAACELLAATDYNNQQITAIGCHGQTIRHRPRPPGQPPFTLQIGDPNIIAEITGITTVADFRRRDMAAGGQGAPLAPALHHAVFTDPHSPRLVLNLGGIANLTYLPVQGEALGFDTGPANGLMDAWISRCRGQSFDRNGDWAASGHCHQALLAHLLKHPYLSLPPPKSTGREEFTLAWVLEQLQQVPEQIADADVQATLLAFSVATIANSVELLNARRCEIFLCGGGASNTTFAGALARALPDCTIRTTEALGIPPDWVEATAFAWLAMRTLNGESGNLPAVTGAKRAAVLGGIYPAG